MKKLFFLILITLTNSLAFAQINYEKTYKKALEKSRASKRPLFIYFNASGVPVDHYFTSGIENEEVVSFYNQHFVNFMIKMGEDASKELIGKYNIYTYPTYLFLDVNEELIFKASKNSITSTYYLDVANEVISRLASGKTISGYDKKYGYGITSKDFLKEYIGLRIKCGFFDNANLIEQYVNYLTIREFNDKDVILFILHSGPFAYGKAYKLAYSNSKVANEAFNSLPEQERIDINNRITNNTFQEALKTRNINMAQQASEFTGTTWGINYKEREKQSTLKMIDYYRLVKDTANYFMNSSYYYDTHYMTISADSIKRAIAKNKEMLDMIRKFSEKKKMEQKLPPDTSAGKRVVTRVVSRMVTVSASGNDVANVLNTVAWNFYELGTTNNNYLGKALLWSKRSIEIDPLPAYYDTLAHIFYRMRLYDEALLNQNKAISLIADQKLPKILLTNARAEAKKMKARTL